MRIVGALVRLYALPVTRIVELTADRFHRDEDGAYLTFDRHPVLLPPKLARLVAEQIDRPGHISMLAQPPEGGPRFLLPSRPRRASSVHELMKRHGLPTISARNTAMIEAVAELPPIVVSDLFGVSAGTAHRWAQYAQDSWQTTSPPAAASSDARSEHRLRHQEDRHMGRPGAVRAAAARDAAVQRVGDGNYRERHDAKLLQVIHIHLAAEVFL